MNILNVTCGILRPSVKALKALKVTAVNSCLKCFKQYFPGKKKKSN